MGRQPSLMVSSVASLHTLSGILPFHHHPWALSPIQVLTRPDPPGHFHIGAFHNCVLRLVPSPVEPWAGLSPTNTLLLLLAGSGTNQGCALNFSEPQFPLLFIGSDN
jgi:hypothetical protein